MLFFETCPTQHSIVYSSNMVIIFRLPSGLVPKVYFCQSGPDNHQSFQHDLSGPNGLFWDWSRRSIFVNQDQIITVFPSGPDGLFWIIGIHGIHRDPCLPCLLSGPETYFLVRWDPSRSSILGVSGLVPSYTIIILGPDDGS